MDGDGNTLSHNFHFDWSYSQFSLVVKAFNSLTNLIEVMSQYSLSIIFYSAFQKKKKIFQRLSRLNTINVRARYLSFLLPKRSF